jgi:hypothetical protein
VYVQGNLIDKGRRMQQAVRDAAEDASVACANMGDMHAEATNSKDRLLEMQAEKELLQAEVSEHSSAAALARDMAIRLQVLL